MTRAVHRKHVNNGVLFWGTKEVEGGNKLIKDLAWHANILRNLSGKM